MPKTTHTHRGTCQACGRVHAVDFTTNLVAKHGYTVDWGYFNGVCYGSGYKPAELDVTVTRRTMADCLKNAEGHDQHIVACKAGTFVPATFKRWNAKKVKINKTRNGTWESMGDYDTLPIAQANSDERRARINQEIRDSERFASMLRSHADMLKSRVLPRLGCDLYPVEVEATEKLYAEGETLTFLGTTYRVNKVCYSRSFRSNSSGRLIGYNVTAIEGHGVGYITVRDLKNQVTSVSLAGEKPASAYPTKVARKNALDQLSRQYDKARDELQAMFLALPESERTEAKSDVYYGPMQLSHWRPKHAEAALREFPKAANIVARINELVKAREAIKAAP